jgi:glycosyltransferase involved in cell wall biosynthesis
MQPPAGSRPFLATLKAALIIPALNEEPVIATTLRSIPSGVFSTIMVADNGSSDNTAKAARACGAVVVVEPERGYGAACLTAIEALPPDTDAIVFMQADASEDPSEAVKLLAPIISGRADLVIGSRTLGTVDAGALLSHQRFGNALATFLIRMIYRRSFTDLGPFRAIRYDSLQRLGMRDRNYGWTVEMQIRAVQLGLRIEEVPVSYHCRVAGENKVSGNVKASLRAGWKIIWTVFRLALS